MTAKPAILVTGGGRGIGAAIARELARGGEHVFVNYRERADAAAQTVAAIIAAGGSASALGADIAEGAAVATMMKTVREQGYWIKILVNNAGLTRDGLVATMPAEAWRQVM